MSKLKTPREKKLASLALDRRNVYGENNKASRKNIPRAKQNSHQAERRAANQPLQAIIGNIDEDIAIHAELGARTALIKQKLQAFKKIPDAPLSTFIERQQYWSKRRREETDYWKTRQPADVSEDQR